MAKKKVFISFDFDNDKELKDTFVGQARLQESPYSFNDFSLREAYPDDEWFSKAQKAISKCDRFIVLLGDQTCKASGVLTEVGIAAGLKKKRFQVKPQRRDPESIPDAGEVVSWKWKNIAKKLGYL
ncbi:MAG: hypothetical protein A2Z28_08730 [Chloroflexi bacterium RBG_16_51_9]|nr:MAG: hypothetical protein A2Z28_08730 [Chloroflexi bacterium RBG_16_51_9]